MVKASVIIPAWNKANELIFALKALTRQTLPSEDFEIIVVDDHSTDNTRSVVRSFGDLLNLKHVTPTAPQRSAARARNEGIRAANSEIIMFLDADVIAVPELLEAHVRMHQSSDREIVTGLVCAAEVTPDAWPLLVTFPDEWDFENPSSIVTRALSCPQLRDQRESVFREVEEGRLSLCAPWAYFWTTNVSVRRGPLEAVGLFDERLAGKGSEDLELGYRLHMFGCHTSVAWQALGFHQPHPRQRTQQIYTDRQHEAYFLRKFPALEIEALVAFDCGNMNAILPALECLARADLLAGYPPFCIDLQGLGLPTECRNNLLIGAGTGDLLESGLFRYALYLNAGAGESIRSRFPSVQAYRLLGVALPFGDETLDAVVITDLWRYLPERLVARICQESLRVGKRVFLLKTPHWEASEVTELDRVLKAHDRPYWERSLYISRTYHDFDFRTVPSSSFEWKSPLLLEVVAKEIATERIFPVSEGLVGDQVSTEASTILNRTGEEQ